MPHNVALFVTCLTDQFYPHVGVAVTKILEKFGCRVGFPQTQTCCGQPFFNNGFHPESRELAKRFIEVFEPYDAVVADAVDALRAGLRDDLLSVHVYGSVATGQARVPTSDLDLVASIERMVLRAEYKRRQAPPGVKIGARNFGRDRRYPITNFFHTGRA